MEKMRLQVGDVMAAAREKGVTQEGDVQWAIFERSGQICIIPRKQG